MNERCAHNGQRAALAVFMLCLSFVAAAEPDSTGELKQLSLEELMDIQVTSVARHPESILQAPASVQVITHDEIRRSGVTSIADALRLADNLQVAQKNSHDWGISARGFNAALANKLLVMIDGRTVYTPLFSGVFWNDQDYLLEDIERIEVISGPGGTLWGANAVNGVINITTKSARDTQGIYAETALGNGLRDAFGVRYGTKLAPGVYVRAYGKFFERDDSKYANGKSAVNAWRKGQGGFRMDAENDAGNLVTVQGDFYQGAERLATGGTSE